MTMLPDIFLGLSAFALAFFGLGAWAAIRHTRAKVALLPDEALAPVSILKPLKGHEELLAENLRTFFAQDYPRFEIVFATTSPDDPALEVARAVAAEHPSVPVQFVLSNEGYGLNPKVSNLEGALRAARYELVLQSDANVRAEPRYLRKIVSELVRDDAALLSSLVVGTGEDSLGAAMENLQLSAMIVPSVSFALRFFGVPCVIGKSMLFRKADLEAVGGLASVKDVLAEDYLLGRAFQRIGKKVLLSATTAENVNVQAPVERFFARHTRWLKMRAVIHPPAFVADFFANPVGLAALAVVASAVVGLELRVVVAALSLMVSKVIADAYVIRRTRGSAMRWRHLVAAPLKDLLLLAILPYAAVSRSIEWRGARLRMGWGTALRPDEGPLPVRWSRRAWQGLRTSGR
ncbi:MAG: glycosyltransferase [Sandaracinaceae bacterium]|jgi:ceramide glucosyltransferase|nr:glycosyltransferase [Sandaracinaceae bacterium]